MGSIGPIAERTRPQEGYEPVSTKLGSPTRLPSADWPRDLGHQNDYEGRARHVYEAVYQPPPQGWFTRDLGGPSYPQRIRHQRPRGACLAVLHSTQNYLGSPWAQPARGAAGNHHTRGTLRASPAPMRRLDGSVTYCLLMVSAAQVVGVGDRLARHYESLAGRWCETSTGDYASLVVPAGNADQPFHGWFHFKEAFSHELLGRVLKDLQLDGSRHLAVFEPFAGAGTTAIALGLLANASELGTASYSGYEANSFLHLLSSTKLRAMQEQADTVVEVAQAVAAAAAASEDHIVGPALSTFGEMFFDGVTLQKLLRLRNALESSSASSLVKDVLRVCLAGTVEPASSLRKDGRALRRTAGPRTTDPAAWFVDRASRVARDVAAVGASVSGAVTLGDIRVCPVGGPADIDLSLFSPPYPNNIDYTEVYKLEAWFLELIKNGDDFRAHRTASLRSHGSLRWADDYAFRSTSDAGEVEILVDPILKAIPPGRYESARRQLILGYADDMLTTLRIVEARLRPGGRMVCIVGNSLHGSGNETLLVAADLLIARLSEIVGLRVDRLEVARVPTRRRYPSRFLRETVIFASKPAN